MAKPGAGKRKMQAQRQKQWNSTVKNLKSTGRAFKGGSRKKGCYIATCVYGSYDCPQVWTLRRFRDDILEKKVLGRLFVAIYYSTSPHLVRLFGNSSAITNHWRNTLDGLVNRLRDKGIDDSPYTDK